MNNRLKLKEEVIADLEEQILIFESKRVKANADLRAAKEHIIALEEEEYDGCVSIPKRNKEKKRKRTYPVG